MPPPNGTAILHVGHGLTYTVQDVLIRWRRMAEDEALWVPGTDHASIGAHVKIEQEIWETEGKTRFDLGREEFLRRAWVWKEKYGNTIIDQMKALGCSCDWSRERFTMDAGYTRAVLTVFKKLYDEG